MLIQFRRMLSLVDWNIIAKLHWIEMCYYNPCAKNPLNRNGSLFAGGLVFDVFSFYYNHV